MTWAAYLRAQTVENLPVNGRDYTKLIYLNPGVSGSPDQISDSPGSFGEFSMNGARGRSNNYLIDGTDMNDGYRNDPAINEAGVFGTPSTILPLDAVAEVNVLSNFQPEYGRNGGRRGQHRHQEWDEFRFTAQRPNISAMMRWTREIISTWRASPKLHSTTINTARLVGGPIIKNKTFFYADYEGQREPVGVVTWAACPIRRRLRPTRRILRIRQISL